MAGSMAAALARISLSPGSAVFSWLRLFRVVRVAQAAAVEAVAQGAGVVGSVAASAYIKGGVIYRDHSTVFRKRHGNGAVNDFPKTTLD